MARRFRPLALAISANFRMSTRLSASAQKGRSSSSLSSASGKSSIDSFLLLAAAPAATFAGGEKLSPASPRPDSRINSRAVISVVYRVWP